MSMQPFIMVVDPDERFCQSLNRQLPNYHFRWSSKPKDSLKLFQEQELLSLIIMDSAFMDDAVQVKKRFPDVPLLMVAEDQSLKSEVFLQGADAFIPKTSKKGAFEIVIDAISEGWG